jgi:hypothetical protein
MKLNLVLQALEKHKVTIQEDRVDQHGNRVIILGAPLPRMPYGDKYRYSTLVLSPGEDEVSTEERDALRRRLCHLTTNIFGDDPDFEGIDEEEEVENGSHLHRIVEKPKDE